MSRYNLRKRPVKLVGEKSMDDSKEKETCDENGLEVPSSPQDTDDDATTSQTISQPTDESSSEDRPSLLDLILKSKDEVMDCTISGNPNLYKASTYRKSDINIIKTIQIKKKGVKKFYLKKLTHLRKLAVKNIVRITSILNSKAPAEVKIRLLNEFEGMCALEYFNPMFTVINTQIKNTLQLYEKLSTNHIESSPDNLIDKILTAKISTENRAKMIQKYERMIEMSKDNSEYSTLRTYLLYGLKIINEPIITLDSTVSKDQASLGAFIDGIKEGLDKVMYGQDMAKDEIIATVVNRVFNINQGNITVFEGQPGTGKTFLARNIASLLGYKFYHISLGGQTSADKILGSLSVYQGSKPGDIFNAVADMGCNNGIILLDEFDKISVEKRELFNAFLNILDPTQNKEFKDNFLHDLNIDLSNIWFIVSVNDMTKVDPIVADRLKNIVHFSNYSLKDKREMLLSFYVPEYKAKYNIDFDISLDESVIQRLIGKSENGGVRALKSEIEILFKRIHILHVLKDSSYKPLYYTKDYFHITLESFDKLMRHEKDLEKVPFGMYT